MGSTMERNQLQLSLEKWPTKKIGPPGVIIAVNTLRLDFSLGFGVQCLGLGFFLKVYGLWFSVVFLRGDQLIPRTIFFRDRTTGAYAGEVSEATRLVKSIVPSAVSQTQLGSPFSFGQNCASVDCSRYNQAVQKNTTTLLDMAMLIRDKQEAPATPSISHQQPSRDLSEPCSNQSNNYA